MSRLDFHNVLGLPEDADATAVRRAYAVRLKAIDVALDPIAFGQLREAYEAALAWLAKPAQHDAPVSAGPAEYAQALETAIPLSDPEDPSIAAQEAIEVLRQQMRELHEDDVDVAMGLTRDMVRSRHIDARARFESLLVDTLRRGDMPKGWAVFHEAALMFDWRDPEHRTALGEHGHWIVRALYQSDAWYRIPRTQRLRWSALVEKGRAEPANMGLSPRIARRWLQVARSAAPLPDFTAIVLPPDLARRWRTQYETKHARTQRIVSAASFLAAIVLFGLVVVKLCSCTPDRRHDSTYDEVYGHHGAK